MYSENYEKPPIPKGYKHTEGEWYNGFVIERECDGSQFVWCHSQITTTKIKIAEKPEISIKSTYTTN